MCSFVCECGFPFLLSFLSLAIASSYSCRETLAWLLLVSERLNKVLSCYSSDDDCIMRIGRLACTILECPRQTSFYQAKQWLEVFLYGLFLSRFTITKSVLVSMSSAVGVHVRHVGDCSRTTVQATPKRRPSCRSK